MDNAISFSRSASIEYDLRILQRLNEGLTDKALSEKAAHHDYHNTRRVLAWYTRRVQLYPHQDKLFLNY